MNPFRKFKALHTPPCRLCANQCKKPSVGLVAKCSCSDYLDHCELKTTIEYTSADASLVRGTHWCRFEPIEEVES